MKSAKALLIYSKDCIINLVRRKRRVSYRTKRNVELPVVSDIVCEVSA